MMIKRASKPAWQKKIADDRIKRLFELAEEDFKSKPGNSKKYIILAKKIAMRYNVKIPAGLKTKFCGNCMSYLKVGVNSRTRIDKGMRIVRCLECSSVKRSPLRK